MSRIKEIILELVMGGVMFFIIFQPPILKISIYNIVIMICVAFVLFQTIKHRKIWFNKRILSIFYSFFPFLCYSTIVLPIQVVGEVKKGEIIKSYLVNMWSFFGLFLFCYVLMLCVKYYDISYDKYCKVLFIAAGIEFVLVILSIMFPTIKDIFVDIMMNNINDPTTTRAIYTNRSFRCFGLSLNIFDGFGYIVSFIVVICMLKGVLEKKVKLIILAAFFIAMATVNARTGLILSLVAVFVILLYYVNDKRYIIAFFLITIVAYIGYAKLPEEIQAYILKGFQASINLLKGNSSVGFYTELKEDLIFPNSVLFGAGAMPEILIGASGIDIGYIQCIWRYGLIGMALVIWGYASVFKKTNDICKTKMVKCLTSAYFIILLLYLFKLFSINNFGANILIIGTSIVLIMDKEKEELII